MRKRLGKARVKKGKGWDERGEKDEGKEKDDFIFSFFYFLRKGWVRVGGKRRSRVREEKRKMGMGKKGKRGLDEGVGEGG